MTSAGAENAMTSTEQRRLRRSAALHCVAVAVFGLLAWSGAGFAAPGLFGLAVPFIVAGLAGAGGATIIAVNVWRLQFEESGASDPDGAAAIKRIQATQRTARRAMAGAAVVVLAAGVVLAPAGIDRGFVIWMTAGLAATLALFALLAGDRLRTAEQPGAAPDPH